MRHRENCFPSFVVHTKVAILFVHSPLGFCSYSCKLLHSKKKTFGWHFLVFRVANLLERFRAGDVTSRYYSLGLGFHPYWLVSSARQKRWRSPFRKRAVNLRKRWHLLKFTGFHQSENPRFSSCFAIGELEDSFHYPAVFHFGERRKTCVYWNLPVG